MKTFILILIYLSTAVGANLTLAAVGPWAMPIIALLFIGLDMTLRDLLHARWEKNYLWSRMLLLILGGSILSWLINPSSERICLASGMAFISSGIVDALIYSLLPRRKWFLRANGSNLGSSAIDSLTFSLLAFDSIKWIPCSLSFLAKVIGGLLVSILAVKVAYYVNRNLYKEQRTGVHNVPYNEGVTI